jgi:hypothetical protein
MNTGRMLPAQRWTLSRQTSSAIRRGTRALQVLHFTSRERVPVHMPAELLTSDKRFYGS